MTTSIFIRSYHNDFPWLDYCLRSIEKYCTGFSEIVIAIPENGPGLDHLTQERVVRVPEECSPYLEQQISKLNADIYTEADNVLYCDSDCIFHTPVTPETFFTDGKPNWLMTPFGSVGDDARNAWFDVMAKCLGEKPEFEMMRRHPQLIPSWGLKAFREFFVEKHGVTMEHYVRSQPAGKFSEFNVAGQFFLLHHPGKFNWMNTDDGVPPTVLKQYWSHGGLTPEIREEIEAVLV